MLRTTDTNKKRKLSDADYLFMSQALKHVEEEEEERSRRYNLSLYEEEAQGDEEPWNDEMTADCDEWWNEIEMHSTWKKEEPKQQQLTSETVMPSNEDLSPLNENQVVSAEIRELLVLQMLDLSKKLESMQNEMRILKNKIFDIDSQQT
jgi:hypothetical protein